MSIWCFLQSSNLRIGKFLEAKDRLVERNGGVSRLSEVSADYKNLDLCCHFNESLFFVLLFWCNQFTD